MILSKFLLKNLKPLPNFFKKILITGATGFVGSRLAAKLVLENFEVHVITRPTSDLWRLKNWQSQIHFHQTDLNNPTAITAVIDQLKPHWVFHLACYGGFSDQIDPMITIQTNILATYYLLEACSKIDIEKFIFVGSSSEYGIQSEPMSENLLERPHSMYGVTKMTASHLVRLFAESSRLPATILRIFSPYGEYDDPKRMIPMVINACLQQRPLKLSSGKSVRDYVYIDDIITAFILAATKAPGAGEIINLGSGKQHSVMEVVNKIVNFCQYPLLPAWGALPDKTNEPKSWIADINKAVKMLGWQPLTSLDDGLKRTINWTKEQTLIYESL